MLIWGIFHCLIQWIKSFIIACRNSANFTGRACVRTIPLSHSGESLGWVCYVKRHTNSWWRWGGCWGFLIAKGGCLFLLMCCSQSAHLFLSVQSRINLRLKLLFVHATAFVVVKLNLAVMESKHLLEKQCHAVKWLLNVTKKTYNKDSLQEK